jgi:flagellar hook protein FlgE
MASTTAMFSGMSGLLANARNLDVIGNNIANVNTTAYKNNRLLFATQFSRTYNSGTSPSENSGGTNPYQVGLGVRTAGTQRNMAAGSPSATGDPRDLAIDGNGFFIVRRGTQEFYTRDGAFRQNDQGQLVNPAGERVMGYGVDADFNIIPGTLTELDIPLGQLTLAEATTRVQYGGNLNANGALPSQGSRTRLQGTTTAGYRAITTAVPAPATGNVAETTTRLVDLEDPLLPGTDTAAFSIGQKIELKNAEKGTKTLPTASLEITATTTIADLQTFLARAMGINTAAGTNPDGRAPGVSIDPVTGIMTVVGNTGTQADLVLDPGDIRLTNAAGEFQRNIFNVTKDAASTGESVRTTVVAFDSLGTPVEVDMTISLESRGINGTTWRYDLESADATGDTLQIGTGTLRFDTEGQLINTAEIPVSLDRTNSGATSPLVFNLAFTGSEGALSALTDVTSEIAAIERDGAPIGTLTTFAVDRDGKITGSFTNGTTRTLGQVAIANFVNPEGLAEIGGNLYQVGANSGDPQVGVPGTIGTGEIIGGALELSNVDLNDEFIKMISASTGYSASSRVIKATDDLMQQLLTLGR